MTRPRVVVMGNAVADIVARPVDDVPRTSSLHPESISFHPGGCAGNTAVTLARLGVEACLVVAVGQDAFGAALLDAWQASGVDCSLVQRMPGINTGVSIVLVDSDGERRFIATPAANHHLTPADLPGAALEGAFALHIGGFFAAPGLENGELAQRLAEARAHGAFTSLDPVGGPARHRRMHLYPLLPHLDLLLLNEDEGTKITDEVEPERMIEALLGMGVQTVILKRGTGGSVVGGAGGPLDIPAFPATCIDSTGAGDAFVGALLASLARGDELEEALHWASAAGAATVEATGATGVWQGWPDLEQIRVRAR